MYTTLAVFSGQRGMRILAVEVPEKIAECQLVVNNTRAVLRHPRYAQKEQED